MGRLALLEVLSGARESQIPAEILNLLNGLYPLDQKRPHPALLVPGCQCVLISGKCSDDTIASHDNELPLIREQIRDCRPKVSNSVSSAID